METIFKENKQKKKIIVIIYGNHIFSGDWDLKTGNI